jgi:HlyD family secretion protein
VAKQGAVDIVRQTTSRRKKAALIGAASVLLTLALGAALMRTSSAAAPVVERAGVWTEKVRHGNLLREVPVQGTLVPEKIQWLSAISAARVAKIAVRPGAAVEPDTVVVVLENADLELAALEAERQAANADAMLIQLDTRTEADQKLQESGLAGLRSDLRDAQRHAAAAERLAPEGLMSELDHKGALIKAEGLADRLGREEDRRQVLESGRARQLTAQRAEVERLREIAKFRHRQLAQLEVRAGVRGIVQDVPLENGKWVAIGTVLAKIAEPDRLKAEVKVAEANAKDVHRGLPVRFESPNGNYRGHVERVDPSVVSGSVRLEVTLEDPLPAGARADQTATGFVEIEKLDNVLYVARPAGARDDSTVSLFRLDADRVHASRLTAKLGRGSAREVEIVSGPGEGDELVVSDVSAWEAHTKVRLK